jgi:hypothetical protein
MSDTKRVRLGLRHVTVVPSNYDRNEERESRAAAGR